MVTLKILALDDSPAQIQLMKERLAVEEDFPMVKYYTDTGKFINDFNEKSGDVNLTIIDYMLDGGLTGMDILKLIVSINPVCKNIIVSGMADRDLAVQFWREGAADFVAKDHENYLDELVHSIRRLLPVVKSIQRLKSKWLVGEG